MDENLNEEIQLVKKVILEAVNRRVFLDSIELHEVAHKVLSIIDSLGGSHDENTIRVVVETKLKEWFGLGG